MLQAPPCDIEGATTVRFLDNLEYTTPGGFLEFFRSGRAG
jgi:hypothetical protein